MKKAISVFLLIVLLFNCCSMIVSAQGNSDTSESTYKDSDIGFIDDCTYDPAHKSVHISGTIKYDTLIDYPKYNIAVYSIPNGKTIGEVLSSPDAKPLAKSAISMGFQFSIKADSTEARFSRYAVVIYDILANAKVVGTPTYPAVTSTYKFTPGERSLYKGLSTQLVSNATASGAKTVIIPVYLNKLINNASSGYIYNFQQTSIFFDKTYIDELDVQVKSLSAVGTKIYLQYLLENTEFSQVIALGTSLNDGIDIPDMRETFNVTLVEAFTSFLLNRYNDDSIRINGMILGRNIDLAYSSNVLTAEEYIENYAFYMTVVGNTARALSPTIDIVLPLSDVDGYSSGATIETELSPSVLLEEICAFFDDSLHGTFLFSTLIQSSSVPYGISDEAISTGDFPDPDYKGINADTAGVYDEHLSNLAQRFDSAPQGFIFLWEPPKDISGDVLISAYVYSYFKLLSNTNLSSFVISFMQTEKDGDYSRYADLSQTIRYIDTEQSDSVTKKALALLGEKSWKNVLGPNYKKITITSKIISLKELDSVPGNILGDYAYHDFSYHTDISSWFLGNDCDSMKINHSDTVGRALEAHFLGKTNAPTEYSEIFCKYEYPETFGFTPDMSMKFSIKNDDKDKEALYEVKLTIGDGKNVAEIIKLCRSYEQITVFFNVSEFFDIAKTNYIKIGVRSLTGEDCGYSLSLASIVGYSSQYTSDQLASMISDERSRVKDDMGSAPNAQKKGEANMVIAVSVAVVIVAVISVGVFMCFKREE